MGAVLSAMFFSAFASLIFLPGLPLTETFYRLLKSALLVVPVLVFLESLSTVSKRSNFRAKLCEAIIYVGFLGALFGAAQQSFDPGQRAPDLS